MKLYYYIDKRGNFGDDLNPWLWQRLIPTLINDKDEELFVGIGTLLNNRIPKEPKKIVFGSGIGYGSGLPTIDETWKFYCVRGPITAAILKLPKECAITDAAALVSTVYDTNAIERSGLAFIPHHVSAWNLNWTAICAEVGIRYIDPRQSVDVVLREIAKSSAIITEAMHGAILADAFRIPWMPVVLYDHILSSKWLDWTQSLSLPYAPVCLDGVYGPDYNFSGVDRLKIGVKRSLSRVGIGSEHWTPPPRKSTKREIEEFLPRFQRLVAEPRFVLSQDSACDETLTRLLERLEQLKEDYLLGGY